MKLKVIFFGLLFLTAWYLSGCQPASRIETLGPRPLEKTISPAKGPIEARIQGLEQLLKADDLDPHEREIIEGFRDVYSYLRQLSLTEAPDSENAGRIKEIYRKIASIEEQFFIEKGKKPGVLFQDISQYHHANSVVFEKFMAHDYEGVVESCRDLERTFGPQALAPGTGLVCALALAEKDSTGEAVEVGEKVMDQLEGRPDLFLLRAKLIEWYLAEGNRDKALHVYGKLSDDMDEKNAFFRSAENRINNTPVRGGGEKAGIGQAEITAAAPLTTLLEKAEQLVQRHAFTEAKLILIKARIQNEDESAIRIIDRALKDIEDRQKQMEQGEGPAQVFSEAEGLEMASTLIEEEKYEEAVETLEEIQKMHQSPVEKTERLKNLAIEKIINRDRNRAARLYLQAKQTEDPTQKKALLQSSRNILKNLVDKYPSSDLIERINEHISTVEKALNDL